MLAQVLHRNDSVNKQLTNRTVKRIKSVRFYLFTRRSNQDPSTVGRRLRRNFKRFFLHIKGEFPNGPGLFDPSFVFLRPTSSGKNFFFIAEVESILSSLNPLNILVDICRQMFSPRRSTTHR